MAETIEVRGQLPKPSMLVVRVPADDIVSGNGSLSELGGKKALR
jgi:hypothetical protein